MDKTSMGRRLFLITTAALCAVAADCGPAEYDSPGSLVQASGSYNTIGPVGTSISTGTTEGPGSDHITPITKITAYANGSYVYGLKLFWGTSSKMYGSTHGLAGDDMDFEEDPVKEIKYHVDASWYLRGFRFKTISNTVYSVGYVSPSTITAFSNADNRFTDLVTYKGSISGVTTIWGAIFYYTGPN